MDPSSSVPVGIATGPYATAKLAARVTGLSLPSIRRRLRNRQVTDAFKWCGTWYVAIRELPGLAESQARARTLTGEAQFSQGSRSSGRGAGDDHV